MTGIAAAGESILVDTERGAQAYAADANAVMHVALHASWGQEAGASLAMCKWTSAAV